MGSRSIYGVSRPFRIVGFVLFRRFVRPFGYEPRVYSTVSVRFRVFRVIFRFFLEDGLFVYISFLVALGSIRVCFYGGTLALAGCAMNFLRGLSRRFS